MSPTRTRTVAATIASVVALLAAGCGTTTGDVIAKYTRGQEPFALTEAPRDGFYGLYSASDIKRPVGYQLQKGDRIGFRRDGNTIYAVAGEKENPIDTSTIVRSWAWKLEKQP